MVIVPPISFDSKFDANQRTVCGNNFINLDISLQHYTGREERGNKAREGE